MFTLAASFAGAAVYGLLALLGSPLFSVDNRALYSITLLGATFAAVWYVWPWSIPIPSPKRQVARHPAVYVPVTGALIFGGLLGTGLLTKIVTPFVWVGVASSFVSGSFLWGLLYGVGFGFGRSIHLGIEYLRPIDDVASRVHRTVTRLGALYRWLGVGLGIGLVGAILLLGI